MSRRGRVWAVIAFALGAPGLALAEPTARAFLEPSQIRVGETASLRIEVRGVQNATAPRIGAPDGLSVRYVGPQTEVSIVNGQMNASVTHQYNVLALSPGSFDIGPIAVEVGGKSLDAGTVRVVVIGAGSPASPPASGNATAPSSGGRPLRLELRTPRTEVYLHERIPLTVVLSVGAIRVEQVQYPTLPGEGFALEKFTEPTQHEETTSAGRVQVVEFNSALTPLKAGPLTVGPAHLTLQVLDRRRGRSVFDSFFGGDPFGMASQPVDLVTPPLALTVLPLPEEGRPAAFSGAVGRYDLDVRAAPTEVGAGDPVTVTLTVRGNGDLDRVTPPAVTAGDGLRAYAIQPRVAKAGEPEVPPATRVFEQVVIPERAGAVEIPPLVFAYFDPIERRYQTITRGPFPLVVRPAAASAPPQIVGAAPTTPVATTPLGADIVSIKDTPGVLRPVGARLWRQPLFWAWQPIPLLIWVMAAAVGRRRRRLAGDARLVRFSRAGGAARRALTDARRALGAGDAVGVHDAVAHAVATYLGAKLDLAPGVVTTEAAARLRARGVDSGVADEVQELFASLERARFAPAATPASDLDVQLARAERIVTAVERSRRLARALIVVVALRLAGGAAAMTDTALFQQANVRYGEGRWREAADGYERVLALGEESGNLYFDLGNAWAKAGDLGRALYAYERAGRLQPGDPDLVANRAFVRARAGLPADDPAPLTSLLFPLSRRMTTDELVLAVAVVWSVGWLLLAATEIVPLLARRRGLVLGGLAIGLVVLGSQAAHRLWTVDLRRRAVLIATEETTIRFEPQESGTPHFSARPGTVLRVLGEREGWVQVEGPAARRGWIPLDAVGLL